MNPIFINYVIQTVKMFILLIIIIIFLRLYMYPLDIICRPEKQSITKIISCNIHGLPFSNDEYYAQRLHSFLLHCRSNCECIVLQEVWYRQVMEIVESALQGWSIVYSPRRFPASTGLLIVGSLAMIGMLRELLDIFTRVWQTLLGKSFIFIIYVIVGNFTLAVAARKVNYITGVDPHSLIYAQGFTTVLVLPLWLLLLTSMSLILLFTLGNLWFLFLK